MIVALWLLVAGGLALTYRRVSQRASDTLGRARHRAMWRGPYDMQQEGGQLTCTGR